MKIKQTIQYILLASLLLVPVIALAFPVYTASAAECAGRPTAIIECGGTKDATNVEDSGLWHLLIIAINVLTGGVGVLALAGVVYGAVLYTSAGGNPEQVKKARSIITNVVIGVIAFAGMFTLLNFIVPGGVFN